jgi:predicted RNase H-like HicB family nuclease
MQLIREAVDLHIESLRKNGEPVPLPHSFVETVTASIT